MLSYAYTLELAPVVGCFTSAAYGILLVHAVTVTP